MRGIAVFLLLLIVLFSGASGLFARVAYAQKSANTCISLVRNDDVSSTDVQLRNSCSKDVQVTWNTTDGSCKGWSCTSTFKSLQNYPANGAKPVKFFACFAPANPVKTRDRGWICADQKKVTAELPAQNTTPPKTPESPTPAKTSEPPEPEKPKPAAPVPVVTEQTSADQPAKVCRDEGNKCTSACDAIDDWAARVQCVSSCIDKTNVCLSPLSANPVP